MPRHKNKFQHKTTLCWDGYYRCPSCNKCYCKHSYIDDQIKLGIYRYTWHCLNGKVLPLKWHASYKRSEKSFVEG